MWAASYFMPMLNRLKSVKFAPNYSMKALTLIWIMNEYKGYWLYKESKLFIFFKPIPFNLHI